MTLPSPTPDMNGWMAIPAEIDPSAPPYDGEWLLASGLNRNEGPDRHYVCVRWIHRRWNAEVDEDEPANWYAYLTHWMPLPAHPVTP